MEQAERKLIFEKEVMLCKTIEEIYREQQRLLRQKEELERQYRELEVKINQGIELLREKLEERVEHDRKRPDGN